MSAVIAPVRGSAQEITRADPRFSVPARYAIHTERLARHFSGVPAVDGVDLRIPPGEIYGFLGPNGAGKSTTVRMLCTLLSPTGGRALVAGHDIAAAPGRVRLSIGVALQDAALDPKQTGSELLRLQGRLYGLGNRALVRRLAELAELTELGDALDRPIGTYSGGMKRRLDLAAALVHNPQILFLDEPTTGLDPASRARVWAEIRRLNQQLGMTIFLTTQYLEEADELAHRVGIIDHGRIVAEGTPGELKRSVGTDVIVARVDGDPAIALPPGGGGARSAKCRSARRRARNQHRRRRGRHQRSGGGAGQVRGGSPRPDPAYPHAG